MPTLPRPAVRAVLSAAIVVSGAAALVYEVVWARQLSVFLGITIRAEAVVLAAFMLGLALGSRLLGRLADRMARPLLFFCGLEAAIGAYGFASIALVPHLAPWYARFAETGHLGTLAGDLLRFAVAALALLLPTFLMGGTVPALVRARLAYSAAPEASLPRVVGTVYALNTAGAAAGALAAGFGLLPYLGTAWTVGAAALANLAIAGGVTLVASRPKPAAGSVAPMPAAPPGDDAARDAAGRGERLTPGIARRPALAAFGVFGAAALALQLGWIQALTQILGSSVYAFSLTLSGYLAGLAGGGWVFVGWARRTPRGDGAHGGRLAVRGAAVAAGAAIAVILGLMIFEYLPGLFLQAFRWNLESRLGWLTAFALLVVWSLLLVPTALFGFLSPLVAAACSPKGASAGEDVGRAYAVNSAGTTAGALLAGFYLLPRVGLQNTLLLGSVGLMASAGLLFLAQRPRPKWGIVQTAAGLLAFTVAAALTPRWDPVLTTSGPFINASRILDLPAGRDFRSALRERNRIVYYRETAIGAVSVRDVAGDRLLVINGKTDGSRIGDRRTQLALGHLPLLLHRQPRRVLVVGFGTGMTPAAVAAHPEVGRLDVVEISPEVIEASRYFAAENRAVLFDARLRLAYADARNYLLTSRAAWDAIISEPSNPWISGVANLFTKEYFELARDRLAPGGIMGQWFQSYGMSTQDLRSVVGTFAGVFENVTVWAPQPGDLILIGSREPHALDAGRAERLSRLPAGALDMATAGWSGSEDFARMLLLDTEAASTFGGGVPANTDRRPRVEFSAPRNMYRETTFSNQLELVEHAAGSAEPDSGVTVPMRNHVRIRGQAFGLAGDGIELEPELRVRWIALEGSRPSPLPTLAVSLRRLVLPRLAGGGPAGPVIEVFEETRPPDRTRLEERLRSLADHQLADLGEGALGDGTPTLRSLPAVPGGRASAAWSCPSAGAVFRVFVVTGAPAEVTALENRLGCAQEPGSVESGS